MSLFVLVVTTIVLYPSTAASARPSCKHTDIQFNCVTYIRNYDGDTITFNIPNTHPLIGHEIGTRVYGVDTPEMKGTGPCEKEAAREAQVVVAKLLKDAKRVEIRNLQRDKYFRILGEVWADGKSVADELVVRKLAYPYFGDTKEKRDWCKKQPE